MKDCKECENWIKKQEQKDDKTGIVFTAHGCKYDTCIKKKEKK